MIRKWMALLLSLLLAMVLPLSALADRQHTLTIIPGEALSTEQAVIDLLEVLDLRVTEGNRSGALTLLLNDQELLTLGLTADTTGVYASSDVFGSDVLYVTWEDGFAYLADQLKVQLAEAGADEVTMQSIEATMTEVKNAIETALGTGAVAAVQPATPSTIEESLAVVEKIFPEDPEMVGYIKGIYEDMTVEEGSFTIENRDVAEQKYRMTMDEADLVAVCDTAYMRTMMLEALAAENPEATQAELNSAADEVIAEVKKLYEESGFELIIEVYTQDEGQTMVGMDMTMNMSIDATETAGEEAKTSMQLTAVYNRLTDAEGVSYETDAAMTVDQTVMEFSFDLDKSNTGMSEGMLGMLADGEEIVVLYQAENTAADTRVRKADMYMRSNATTILKPAAANRPVIGFELTTEPADEAVLDALENAKPDTSVNVMKLSDDAMQALGNQIMSNAMQVFYTALGQLPTSVINLLMSNAQ